MASRLWSLSQSLRGLMVPETHAEAVDGEEHSPSEETGSAEASAESGALLLPTDLLVKVLEKVPQKFRLTSCVRVCHAWHEAGIAASTNVQLSCLSNSSNATRLNSLLSWLSKHGQHVTSLFLSRAGTPAAPLQLAQLPCSQLKELSLRRCHLQLTAAGDAASHSLSRLTSLTRLSMGSGGPAEFAAASSNTLVDYPDCFSALTQLTGLQHLEATAEALGPLADDREEFPAGVLSSLVHLTHLGLNLFAVTAPALEGLTRLSNLQSLDAGTIQLADDDSSTVDEAQLVPGDALAAVAGLQNLTSLQTSPGCVLGSSSTPGFSTLTALRKLVLYHGAGLDPSVLAHFTGLQELRLWCTPVVAVRTAARPAPRGRSSSSSNSSGSSSTEGLLAVLPRLQQLQKLELFSALPDTAPAAQYSALISSSKLQNLLLTGSELPKAAWKAMFGGRRQLRSLTSLTFNGWINNSGGKSRLNTQDLHGLARSCPALQNLCVHGSVDAAADYGVLRPLQHLSSMFVSNISDASAGLERLTTLESLVVMQPNSLTDAGLRALTALTRLDTLQQQRGSSPGQDDLHFMSATGSPPDVSRQLQRYLRRSPAARAGHVSSGVQEFQEALAYLHNNLY